MWNPTENSTEIRLPMNEIVIDKVLYAHDGPMIFTARFGMSTVLFSRIEETDTLELYAAGTVSEEITSAIETGSLSVLGGVLSEPCFIFEMNGLSVLRCWQVPVSDMPHHLLPVPGVSLFPGKSAVPDSILRAPFSAAGE